MQTRWLAECEREALHLSGAIQPHGVLLVVGADGRLSHVSDNVGAFLGGAAADWLGRGLPEPLPSLVIELPAAPGSRLVREAAIEVEAGWLDAVVMRSRIDAVESVSGRQDPRGETGRRRRASPNPRQAFKRSPGSSRSPFLPFRGQGPADEHLQPRPGTDEFPGQDVVLGAGKHVDDGIADADDLIGFAHRVFSSYSQRSRIRHTRQAGLRAVQT